MGAAIASVGAAPPALATVAGATLSVSTVATGAPSATGVALGTITFTDVTGGAVSSGDVLELTLEHGATFTEAGTVTGAISGAVGSPTIASVDITNDSLQVTAVKTSAVGDTLIVTGAQVALPSSPGEYYLTAYDATTSTIFTNTGVVTAVNQARIGGSDRYATATLLYDGQFSSATSVVLTSGTNYPDALSAVYLAGQLHTGVLTTNPSSLSGATKQELVANAIATVYIVGGPAAVSQGVEDSVKALHVGNDSAKPTIAVVRVYGDDRFATNNKVDTYRTPAASTTAIVATGDNFADALAVGPAVYRTGDPLILTDSAALSQSAKDTIATLGITHAIIVGGTSAVSASVETALAADGVTVDYRIAGADRTVTAADIATWETTGLPASGTYGVLGGLGFTDAGLANISRGDGFADALAAGPLAGAEQNVILLTRGPTQLGSGIPQYFSGRAGTIGTVRALGLTAAVSDATLTAAATSLTQPFTG